MRLHWKGNYSGDESSLAHRDHPEGTAAFREPETAQKLAARASLLSGVILMIAGGVLVVRGKAYLPEWSRFNLGVLLSLASLLPHELLHAICFREDVYLYFDLKHGMIFVQGTEDMSKTRFILMSLLPNLVFGVIPYVLFLLFPEWMIAGVFGMFCLSAGAGDYLNVWAALTQMPRGAITFMDGFHSFWYLPSEKTGPE